MTHSKQVMYGLVAGLLLTAAPARAGSTWVIEWWTIDAGGEMVAEDGAWTLSGTIGQWDATESMRLVGQNWAVTGGFWAGGVESGPKPDALFSDRFEQ